MKPLWLFLIFNLFITNGYAEEKINPADLFLSPNSQSDLFNFDEQMPVPGFEEETFLPADQAFIFSLNTANNIEITASWVIAEGYYLYRDKIKFRLLSEGQLGEIQLPPSKDKEDPEYGTVQVYQQPVLDITVPITTSAKTITIEVKYQGCADAGLCYPPETKTVDLRLGEPTSNSEVSPKTNSIAPLSEQDQITQTLINQNLGYILLAFFGFGFLLAFTPCVFPMIPILSSLIVGQGEQVSTFRAFTMSLVYVLAMAFAYAIIGGVAGLLGENLPAILQNPWVLSSFSIVFIALAFSMFGFYELQLPSSLQTKLTQLSSRQQGGTLIGVFIMGLLSALIVGPCVAPPLVGAFIYISQTQDWLLGGLALFTMGLGMGVPLIIVGTSIGRWLPKSGGWMDNVKSVFGVLLLALAIWMLERILPATVSVLLWASLLIISSIYMNVLDSLDPGVSGWRKLWKGLGIIFLVYGILLMIGVAGGRSNLLQPLDFSTSTSESTQQTSVLPFQQIKGVTGLEQALSVAKGQPVMFDFYADWCVSCKEMEHFTFSDPQVKQLLSKMVLLQTDTTAHDAQDKALYKHTSVVGPPSILFFSKTGEELKSYRVVGFMSADKFAVHLQQVLKATE